MFHKIRNGLILSLAILAFVWAPRPADAQRIGARYRGHDGYWNHYWGWYDNDYRPYYHRHHHYYRPHYDYYYDPYRRHSMYGPHHSLEIGPLHFDWR